MAKKKKEEDDYSSNTLEIKPFITIKGKHFAQGSILFKSTCGKWRCMVSYTDKLDLVFQNLYPIGNRWLNNSLIPKDVLDQYVEFIKCD